MGELESTIVVQDPLLGLSVGGYRIERLLAEGGMGLVYQARHELIDRRFAVKVLKPEVAGDLSVVKNFLAEAQTLSALKHPNIIDIVGFGPLPDGRQYMVMEFLEGRTLEEEMHEGRLTLERVLHVADQTLAALSAAHSVEVIHRDLKPSNVFLARGSGGVEVVKLLDFGLARQQPVAFDSLDQFGSQGPAASVVSGTPEYVAPEQALGGGPDKSSDLYSFGVMLFEMLTGRLPFEPDPWEANRPAAFVQAHAYQAAPSPQQIGAQVQPRLTALLAELLQKSPQARPVSAEVVRQRLMTSRSLPIPLLQLKHPTAWRWRAPAAAAGLAAMLISGVVLLGSSFGSAAPAPVITPAIARASAPGPLVPPPPEEPKAQLSPAAPLPAPPRIARVALVRARRSPCVPDERWRTATRINVQELQQLAAKSSARWAEFERLEPALSGQINTAFDAAQCNAAEQRIRKLAHAWRR